MTLVLPGPDLSTTQRTLTAITMTTTQENNRLSIIHCFINCLHPFTLTVHIRTSHSGKGCHQHSQNIKFQFQFHMFYPKLQCSFNGTKHESLKDTFMKFVQEMAIQGFESSGCFQKSPSAAKQSDTLLNMSIPITLQCLVMVLSFQASPWQNDNLSKVMYDASFYFFTAQVF